MTAVDAARATQLVMPGLDPGIHASHSTGPKDVDGGGRPRPPGGRERDRGEKRDSNRQRRERSMLPGFGELYFDAQLDLGEHSIEPRIAGGVFEAPRRGAQQAYGWVGDLDLQE